MPTLRIDRPYWALALMTALSSGCSDSPAADSPSDAGADDGTSPVDSGPVDTGADAGADSATDSATDSAADSAADSATDSAADTAASCAPNVQVLAIRTLSFGEGNSGQWKKFGFDLDGKTSAGDWSGLCQPSSGASAASSFPDGDLGIDNAFGKNLLPVLLSLDPTWASDVNGSLQNGDFTTLLELTCLAPTGDVAVLPSKLFGATSLGAQPKWDGTDKWPVDPSLLSNPTNPESSTLVYPTGSLAGTTFDAGRNLTLVLAIPLKTGAGGAWIHLTLHAARLTMSLSADRKSATAGMIGGVLDTEALVAEYEKLGYALGICSTSLLGPLVTQVRQASDIMADGTQDPTKTCNGISIGLGFEVQPAQLGGVGPAVPASASCP